MKRTLAFILPFILLNGCLGRIPEPVDYEFSEQQKMQAAHHWDVLAMDVANRINNELLLNDYLETPVHIRQTCGDEDTPCKPFETSTFDEAFRDLLITDLVNLGVPVKHNQSDDSITVHYKVQLVYHRANRVRTIRPGLITSLTTAVMVLRNVPTEVVAVATAGLVDIANQNLVHNGHYEVIITTSMINGGEYLYRGSDIYYINDKDSFQYRTTMPQTATIPLVAPQALAEEPETPSLEPRPLNTQSTVIQEVIQE